MPADRFKLILSLLATYLVWGSTYLAIRIGVESFPPLMLAALRFLLAGGSMYLWLRLRGVAAPSPLQWRNAALIGGMMLTIANGSVTYAEKTVSSGLAALVVGLVVSFIVAAGGLALSDAISTCAGSSVNRLEKSPLYRAFSVRVFAQFKFGKT